ISPGAAPGRCEEIRESEEQKAERIILGRCAFWRWTSRDLQRLVKGDKREIDIARLLRNQTTMTLKWIARRLNMGMWTYLRNRLRHVRLQHTWDRYLAASLRGPG